MIESGLGPHSIVSNRQETHFVIFQSFSEVINNNQKIFFAI